MNSVTFYFDYLSPFSYFAWRDLTRLAAPIDYRPTPLGPLLNHWGIKGPGEVQPKREFLLKQCLRKAIKEDIPFTTPKTHPFNSLYALRLSVKEVAGDLQEKVIACLWKAGWNERIDMGDPDQLVLALMRAGLPADELYEKSFASDAKKAIKNNLAKALSQGVFGVPSFVYRQELFWGADAMNELNDFILNKDCLDRQRFQELLDSTPRAAQQSLS